VPVLSIISTTTKVLSIPMSTTIILSVRRVNPQKENSQTDKKSENVRRGRGRARPLRSEVTTNHYKSRSWRGVLDTTLCDTVCQ
jgi:hypothetical protein